jgi:hypothetical protein
MEELFNCLNNSKNGEYARSIVSDIVYKCGENMSNQTICKRERER